MKRDTVSREIAFTYLKVTQDGTSGEMLGFFVARFSDFASRSEILGPSTAPVESAALQINGKRSFRVTADVRQLHDSTRVIVLGRSENWENRLRLVHEEEQWILEERAHTAACARAPPFMK